MSDDSNNNWGKLVKDTAENAIRTTGKYTPPVLGATLGSVTGGCVNASLFTGVGFCIAGPAGGAAGYMLGLSIGIILGGAAGFKGSQWAFREDKK